MIRRQSVHIRLPADLHRQLVNRAVEQDVALNTLIVALLAGGVGFRLEQDPAATKAAATTTRA